MGVQSLNQDQLLLIAVLALAILSVVLLTTTIITFVSSLISILLGKAIKEYENEKFFYEILPLYQNRNLLKIDLNLSNKPIFNPP